MALDLSKVTAEDLAKLRDMVLSQGPVNQGPPVPETPPLTMKDVLYLLVRHVRLPDEATQTRCYAAIDEAYPEPVEDETVDETSETSGNG